jgi:hypothetical protein
MGYLIIIYGISWITTNRIWFGATICFVVSFIDHVPFNKQDVDQTYLCLNDV